MISLCVHVLTFMMCVLCVHSSEDCVDHPLILTTYLEAGKIVEAQGKALVTPDIQGVKSYSGFFTVNKECGNNLFFWFITAKKDWKTAPVLLWLPGDMGSSALNGMFAEIGPFNYFKGRGFVKNEYPWTDDNNVIFLDQPVGAGFSFTEKGCYVENTTESGVEIYSALLQFFTLFPELQKNRFFLTGGSISGHYVPATAYEIDRNNEDATIKINLVGFFIGNPFIDISCINNGPFLYELGIVDENGAKTIEDQFQLVSKYIHEKKYAKAFDTDNKTYSTAFSSVKLPNTYNILEDHYYIYEYQVFLRNYKVRKQLHVGNVTYHVDTSAVYNHLAVDMYRPSTPIIEKLLKSGKYIVGFYSGQLDMRCLYRSLPCVLRQLEWEDSALYQKANMTAWYEGGRLTGWYKVAGNLFEVVFRDAGHQVARDQARAALEFISAAVTDSPGTKLLTKLETTM